MLITPTDWLDTAKKIALPPLYKMSTRRALVIHFTGGASAKSSIEAMRQRGVSAHLTIDRDGTIFQSVAFSTQAAHAGVSRWRDPKTDLLYNGLNAFSIGIELANAGNDPDALAWAKRQPGFSIFTGKHQNGGPIETWENFPTQQLTSLFSVSKLLVTRYNLDDITGHDCIAPERKNDPGPAFPMLRLRTYCGFVGLPKIFPQ
jgi:N-acetylmuramoyl-L-alanine amidase